jgi:hypothetical protein
MKWCLACKFEYEDYVQTCTDCGAMLVTDECYQQTMTQKKLEKFPEAPNLVAVYESTLESDVLHVSALLKDHGIYSEIKNEGIGSYLQIYGGVNYLGTTICVSEVDAELARSIVQSFWREVESDAIIDGDSSDDTDEDEPSMEAYRRSYDKSMQMKKNLLKLFILLIFGTGIIYQILSIISQL